MKITCNDVWMDEWMAVVLLFSPFCPSPELGGFGGFSRVTAVCSPPSFNHIIQSGADSEGGGQGARAHPPVRSYNYKM